MKGKRNYHKRPILSWKRDFFSGIEKTVIIRESNEKNIIIKENNIWKEDTYNIK